MLTSALIMVKIRKLILHLKKIMTFKHLLAPAFFIASTLSSSGCATSPTYGFDSASPPSFCYDDPTNVSPVCSNNRVGNYSPEQKGWGSSQYSNTSHEVRRRDNWADYGGGGADGYPHRRRETTTDIKSPTQPSREKLKRWGFVY